LSGRNIQDGNSQKQFEIYESEPEPFEKFSGLPGCPERIDFANLTTPTTQSGESSAHLCQGGIGGYYKLKEDAK
jgi:hypothetical protein